MQTPFSCDHRFRWCRRKGIQTHIPVEADEWSVPVIKTRRDDRSRWFRLRTRQLRRVLWYSKQGSDFCIFVRLFSFQPNDDNPAVVDLLTHPSPHPGPEASSSVVVSPTSPTSPQPWHHPCTHLLQSPQAKIYVRCGRQGLKAMHLLSESLGVPIRVFSPDTLALGLKSTTCTTAPISIPLTAPGSPNISPAILEPGASEVTTMHASGERT